MAVEALSQTGYVVSWVGVLDPDGVLAQRGHVRGLGLASRIAWAQLGGGMVVPGGTIGSMGVGAWMLSRLGMPLKVVAERQFVLMFLNTGIDAIAVVIFGLLLAVTWASDQTQLLLTLVPAVVVAIVLVAVVLIARRAETLANRLREKRPRAAVGIGTLARAVEGTDSILRHRGSTRIILGAVAYLGFDVAVLWGAFSAIGANPLPNFAVVMMSYLIGGLGGSIPLPANLGAVTGMAAMLIAFGVNSSDAIAAVVLYQAIGFLVPLIGGGIAYLFLRRELGRGEGEASQVPATGDSPA